MGGKNSKVPEISLDDRRNLEPEPDYTIKTRSPKPTTWQLNIMRGKREDDLRNEAYPIARRKCHKDVDIFAACEKKNGLFWTSFNCLEEYEDMSQCFNHEFLVEMDKMRRDMTRHPEWWWRSFYDEDGEIGEQKEWNGEYWLLTKLRNLKDRIYHSVEK